MKELYSLVILMLLIGAASAAVYVTYNPEARVYFDRPSPGPEVLAVVSSVQMDAVGWTGSYGYGTMTGDILELNMHHENGNASIFNGIVYFEIECDQGIVDHVSNEGMWDFVTIEYTDPAGNLISCNNDQMVTRLSDTKIRIIPTLETYPFEYGVGVYTSIFIEFLPMSYGDYVLWIFVDDQEVI